MSSLKKRILINISSEEDIIVARQKVKEFASEIGFQNMDTIIIATAVSEVTRNVILYAKKGTVEISCIEKSGKEGIQIITSDKGPGIENISLALQDGFSTGQGLGLGLPGTKRLMDEFEIISEISKGTTIIMGKWK